MTPPAPTRADLETERALELLRVILDAAPARRSTSAEELRAQEMLLDAFRRLGLEGELRPFRFNESIYANLALHFGVGLAGSAVSGRAPLLGLVLHLLAAISYAADSAHAGVALRRLLPQRPSQNLVVSAPAPGGAKLRIVFVAHADSSFTGTIFQPWFLERFAAKSGPLRKSLRVATGSLAALAAVDALRAMGLLTPRQARVLTLAGSIPVALTAALNLDVVLRDTVVPGANDNLSGCVGLVLLAERLLASRTPHVEWVFVVTGCEEAGLGGADALSREAACCWDPRNTVVIGLDGLSNGDLRCFTEGEVFPVPLARWLMECVRETAASEPRFADVQPFDIPVGGTDIVPFVRRGFDAVCLGTVDPGIGTPRHYHQLADNLDNLDVSRISSCLDFVEALVANIVRARLPG